MDFFEQIVAYFNKPEEDTKNSTPEGVCPVCWGYQEYDQKIRQLLKDDQIDVINHKKKYTKIRKFLMENVDGIRLKTAETFNCPNCNAEDHQND